MFNNNSYAVALVDRDCWIGAVLTTKSVFIIVLISKNDH